MPSGRSDSERSPRSVKVYISLLTTSVDSPTPRAKTSVASNAGRLDVAVPGQARAVGERLPYGEVRRRRRREQVVGAAGRGELRH